MSWRDAGESPRVTWELQGLQIVPAPLSTKVFLSPFVLIERVRKGSECILKTGIGVRRCRAVASRCKWQTQMKCAHSGSLFERSFLALRAGCQPHAWLGAVCGVSALRAHRGRVTGEVWAPNDLRSQWRTYPSSAMYENHAATFPSDR